ncbi:MAG: sulfatase-like hydrolase/transferase [Planctomycetales bacterium]|nr:sulfatase-like hydrolase/transferase [Planctomycetales bacterium]
MIPVVAWGQQAWGQKPNIVFMMADDLGIGDVGYTYQLARAAAGLPAIRTPNIDQLAAQGTRFSKMYAGASICSPSRASLLTGFELQHIKKEQTDAPNGLRGGTIEDRTWGQMLQEAGYATGMWGKWHVGGVYTSNTLDGLYDFDAIPTQKGFDTAYGTMGGGYRARYLWESDGTGGLQLDKVPYDPTWPGPGASVRFSQDITNEHAVDYIRAHANQSEPFAAYIAYSTPHQPFNNYGFDDYADEDWEDVEKQYAAMVTALDRHVGDVIAAIEDPNGDGDRSDSIADNTLIIFTSDNGPIWPDNNPLLNVEFFDNNGPYRGEKTNTYEAGMLVPFVARWDGVTQPGSENSEHVGSFADVFATLAEVTGSDTPFGLDGQSMLAAIRGEEVEQYRSDALVWTANTNFDGLNQAGYAVRLGDWKVIYRMYTNEYELFDIATDPYETNDLASSRPDIVAALTAVAQIEGVLEEPYIQTASNAQGYNRVFTQYKYWSLETGNLAFAEADNWTGGTQTNRPGEPDSLYWNTGPAINWLAKVDNYRGGFRNAWVTSNATVLAMEIAGSAGTMQVNVNASATLEAHNGVRVSSGGILRLNGGTLVTAREVDVREGGVLAGSGLVGGWQSLIESVPELSNQGFLQPTVLNAGVVDVQGDIVSNLPGVIEIQGDYRQSSTGQLIVDLFDASGGLGFGHDGLQVDGAAVVAGYIVVQTAEGFAPQRGDQFTVIAADHLVDAGVRVAGPLAHAFMTSVANGVELVLTYVDADFSGDGAVSDIDLQQWESSFGMPGGVGDADGDGQVNGRDFLAWQRAAGTTTGGAASVPEPAAWLLLVGSAITVLCSQPRRRRRHLAIHQ